MTGFLSRLLGRYRAAAAKRDDEVRQMSPRERAFVQERVEEHGVDELVDSQLGGRHPRFHDDVPRT